MPGDRLRILMLRVLHKSSQGLQGLPSAILFPGVPIKPFSLFPDFKNLRLPYGTFGDSYGGVLSLEPLGDKRVFINDGYTGKDTNFGDKSNFPKISPVSLLSLYIGSDPARSFGHNETEFSGDDHVPCLVDLDRIDDMRRLMDERKMSDENLCYYDKTTGKFYHLDDRNQPEEEIKFGPEVLSRDSFSSEEIARVFREEYARDVADFAEVIKLNHGGLIPRWIEANAPKRDGIQNPAEIFFDDVRSFIASEKIADRPFEISGSSIRNLSAKPVLSSTNPGRFK